MFQNGSTTKYFDPNKPKPSSATFPQSPYAPATPFSGWGAPVQQPLSQWNANYNKPIGPSSTTSTPFIFGDHTASNAKVSSQPNTFWQPPKTSSFAPASQQQTSKQTGGIFSNIQSQSHSNASNTSSFFKTDPKNATSAFPSHAPSPLKKWPAFTAAQPPTGTQIKFEATPGVDAIFKNGKQTGIMNTHSQCCTVMKEYENKSLEELRFEDYQTKCWNKKPQMPTLGNNQTPNMALFQHIATSSNNSTSANLFLPNSPTNNSTTAVHSGTTTAPSDATKPGFKFTWPPQPVTSTMPQSNTSSSVLSTLATSSSSWNWNNSSIPTNSWSLGMTPTTSSSPQITNAHGSTGFPVAAPSTNQSLFPLPGASLSLNRSSGTPTTIHQSQGLLPFTNSSSMENPSCIPISAPAVNSGNMMCQGAGGYSLHCLTTPMTILALPHYHIHDPCCQNTTKPPFATTPFKDANMFDYHYSQNKEPTRSNSLSYTRDTNQLEPKLQYRSSSAIYDLSRSPAISKITYANPKPNWALDSISGRRLPKLFEGFEEESLIKGVDVLSPTSNPKRLDLKAVRLASELKNAPPKLKIQVDSIETLKPMKSKIDCPFEEILQFSSSNETEYLNLRNLFMSENKKTEISQEPELSHVTMSPPAKSLNDDRSEVVHNPAKRNTCGVTCTRHGYYTIPSIEELDKMTDEYGHCFVQEFIVGRNYVGHIRFLGVVNVYGLNIDEIVLFRHKVLEVYPDEMNKPDVGVGLNCPAEIELVNVWPVDNSTNDLIKDAGVVQRLNYADKLKRACVRQNAEFVNYCNKSGKWKFRVQHF